MYKRQHPESRKPEVTFSADVVDDLARRDFTVNAMALEVTGTAPELIDPFDGAADLAASRLRTPSGPQAVSYTHLDVYKRQVLEQSDADRIDAGVGQEDPVAVAGLRAHRDGDGGAAATVPRGGIGHLTADQSELGDGGSLFGSEWRAGLAVERRLDRFGRVGDEAVHLSLIHISRAASTT